MTTGRTDKGRLDRLAGSEQEWGGGLPLPLLFAAMLEELLDKGQATTNRMVAIASDKLAFKAEQIATNQAMGGARAAEPDWPAFATDVLAQMESQEIIRQQDGVWVPGPEFDAGKPLIIIPARKGRKADSITVWEKEERGERGRLAHLESEINSAVGSLRPDGAGLRPVDPQRAAAIRDSAAQLAQAGVPQLGQLYPVLVDPQGRILDGKHRKKADPLWREAKIEIDSDEMRLAVALWANSGRPLPAAVSRRIENLILGARTAAEIQRDRIRAALADYPELSHKKIAKLAGTSDVTVGKVCREEVQRGSHLCTHGQTGQGARTDLSKDEPTAEPKAAATSKSRKSPGAPRKQDDPALHAEITRRILAGERVNAKQLGEQFGMGAGTVQLAEGAVRASLAAEQAAAEAQAAAASVAEQAAGPEQAAEPELNQHLNGSEDEYQWVRTIVMEWAPELLQRLIDEYRTARAAGQ